MSAIRSAARMGDARRAVYGGFRLEGFQHKEHENREGSVWESARCRIEEGTTKIAKETKGDVAAIVEQGIGTTDQTDQI